MAAFYISYNTLRQYEEPGLRMTRIEQIKTDKNNLSNKKSVPIRPIRVISVPGSGSPRKVVELRINIFESK